MDQQEPRVIVVGEGWTAWAYAYWQRRAGAHVRILAAEDGGSGRAALSGEEEEALLRSDVLHALGLEARARPAPPQPLRVHTAVGPRPLAPSRLDLVLPRLRAATRDARGARHETLATWSKRVLGATLTRRWIEPQVRAVHCAAPQALGASDAWPTLLARVARHGPRALMEEPLVPTPGGAWVEVAGGRTAVRQALAPDTSATRVVAVEAAPHPSVQLASGERLEADRIALALPPRRQAALLEGLAPGAVDDLHAWPMADRAEVRLVVPSDPTPMQWPRPGLPDLVANGAGLRCHAFAVASTEGATGRATQATTIHAWLGGPLDPDALDLDDDLLARIVEVDLGRILGRSVTALAREVTRFPRSLPIPRPGTRARLTAIRERLAPQGIVLLGSHVMGNTLDDQLRAGAPPLVPLPEDLALI